MVGVVGVEGVSARPAWDAMVAWIMERTPDWLDPYVASIAAFIFLAAVVAAFIQPLVSVVRATVRLLLAWQRRIIRRRFEKRLRNGEITPDQLRDELAQGVRIGLSDNILEAYCKMWTALEALPVGAAGEEVTLKAPVALDPQIGDETRAFIEAGKSADRKERDALASLIQGHSDLALAQLNEAAIAAPQKAAQRYRRFATLIQKREPELARRVFEEAIKVDGGHAGAHHALGQSYRALYKKTRRMEDLRQAANAFERAADLSRGKNAAGEADALSYLGECLRLLRTEDDRALASHQRALELKKQLPAGARPAANHHGIGLILAKRGQLRDALRHHEMAAELERRQHNEGGYLGNASISGVLRRRLGELRVARQIHETVLKAYAHQSKTAGPYVSELNNLGVVLRLEGHLSDARARHDEARAICEQSGDAKSLAIVLGALGEVALAESQYDQAEALFNRARDEWMGVDPVAARVQADRTGVILRLKGRLEAADAIHRATLEIAPDAQALRVKLNIAWVKALKRDRSAMAYVRPLREAFEAAGQALEMAECRLVQAHVLRSGGNKSQALVHLKAAMEIYARAGARRMQSETHRLLFRWQREFEQARKSASGSPE